MDNRCTYCGFESDLTREHVIPVVWLGRRVFNTHEQWIVPACRSCNNLAGSEIFFSIPAKASYIKKKFVAKYRKLLRMPYWPEEEISELDPKLQNMIRDSAVQKRMLERRVKYMETIEGMPVDYLRPKFVESQMKELEREHRRILREIKRNAKNNNGKIEEKT